MWSPENRSLGGERRAAAVALIVPGGAGTKVNVVFRSVFVRMHGHLTEPW